MSLTTERLWLYTVVFVVIASAAVTAWRHVPVSAQGTTYIMRLDRDAEDHT